MWRMALCAVAAVSLASSAVAADLPTHKPAPVLAAPIAPPFSWTGPYVGLLGGYSWDGEEIYTNTWSHGVPRSGPYGGLELGYNYQINSFVVGVAAEYNIADITGSVTPLPTYSLNTRVSSFGSLDGHLGFAFNRFVIYGLGGVAGAEINHSITLTGIESDSFSAFETGYDVGLGASYAITNNISATAEFHDYEFGTKQFGPVGLLGPHHTFENLKAVLLGLSYSFGS
jgi:outer membrane immunogenic protein